MKWQEAVIFCYGLLSQQVFAETEENQKTLSQCSMSPQNFMWDILNMKQQLDKPGILILKNVKNTGLKNLWFL